MAYKYGYKSNRQRKTLYPWIQLIFLKVLEVHDHSLDQGGREDSEQWALFNADPPATTLHPPDGKHLLRVDPTEMFDGLWSFAVDTTPWINNRRLATRGDQFGPEQQAQFARFLGIVEQIGRDVLSGTGWHLRFGYNWDEDAEILTDQDFDDFFHIEIVRN